MATTTLAQSTSTFNPSDYPHTYLASASNKIVLTIVSVILGAGLLVGGYFAAFPGPNQRNLALVPLIVIFGLILVAVSIARLAMYRFRLVLYPDRIDYESLFKSWTIYRSDITNWKLSRIQNSQYLELTSSDATVGRQKCSLQFKPDDSFTAWFADLHNSDAIELKQSEEEIRQNPDFGATPEERLDAANRARKVGTVLSVCAGLIGYWCMLYPYPNMLPLWLCLAMPWCAMLVCRQSKGMYTLGRFDKKSAKTNLFLLVMMGAMGLAFRATMSRNVVNLADLLVPAVVVALVLAVAIGLVNNWYSRSLKQFLPYLIFCAAYGFGAVAATNHLLDHGARTEVPVRIMDKYQTHGKGAASYLILSAWGSNAGNNDLKVDHDYYRSKAVGETICIYMYQGFYHIPWFNVGDCIGAAPVIEPPAT